MRLDKLIRQKYKRYC